MIRTIAGAALALLFIIAAGLQYNDSDGQGWIAVYAMAAVACAALAVQGKALGGIRRGMAFGVAGVAAVWVLLLAPVALREGIALGNEVSREVGGLIVVAVGVGVMGVVGPGRRVKRAPKPRAAGEADGGGAE